MIEFQYNDGGRAEAGYQGTAGDCTVRAIAIATEQLYQDVYDALFALNKQAKQKKASPRDGTTTMKTMKTYMDALGWKWTPTMKIGSGCEVHLRADELPNDRLVVRVSKHVCAVIHGVLHDTHDCSRDGKRCVYGYFSPSSDE